MRLNKGKVSTRPSFSTRLSMLDDAMIFGLPSLLIEEPCQFPMRWHPSLDDHAMAGQLDCKPNRANHLNWARRGCIRQRMVSVANPATRSQRTEEQRMNRQTPSSPTLINLGSSCEET